MHKPTAKRQIGIMGGSFNPVHAGHIMLASWLAQFGGVDETWLMLSPANPLKQDAQMVSDRDRLEMLDIACRQIKCVKPCDIELSMPRPSYTINSLDALAASNPDCRFRLIIGSDNWLIFDRWKCHEEIIRKYHPIIYPRPGYEIDPASLTQDVALVNAPVIEISSTFIRQSIADGRDMQAFLPAGVNRYISDHHLYY